MDHEQHNDSALATAARAPEETPTVVVRDAARALELVPGALLAGRYRIVSRLGRGGMGEVYRADDLRLGQPVALKFLRPGSRSTEREQQLLDEVRLGREISHPNVCRVHDVGEVEGHLFISMEYIDGEDLGSLIRRIGRLPHDKALAVAREIGSGLAAAHDRGILHRDLKPANIMIDGRGHARITDFGLAAFESGQERTGSGTPAYMAPEQLGGEPASIASDVFALGLTLSEMWTGKRLISGNSISEIVEQHRTDSARTALRRATDVDPTIVAVIEACLAPEPVQRPVSARAVLTMLPGRDAVDAAVAAGETPSPGMVAAASERGDLSRGRAWLGLASVLASVLAIAAISARSTVEGVVGLPFSPDALEAKSQKLIADLGWATPETSRRDSAAWFQVNGNFVRARDQKMPVAVAASPSHAIAFVYRQSPGELIPHKGGGNFRVSTADPEFDFPGMIDVVLTPDGMLREFSVVPPSLPSARGELSWTPLLVAAGLDPAAMKAAPPQSVCPVDNDRKMAWSGFDPADHTPIRVEAASLRGRPVWFYVVSPWAAALRRIAKPPGIEIANALTFVLLIAIPPAVALLARRNLRRGQGDRKGAARIAVAVLVLLTIAGFLRMHHVVNHLAEGENLTLSFAMWLMIAGGVWLAYIAFEPFVRRRWPRMLISWSRFVEGRWRDPMIGRDLLVGFAAGALLIMATHAVVAFGAGGESLRIQAPGSAYSEVRQVLFYLPYNGVEAIARGAALIALLMLLRGLLRSQIAAIAVAVAVLALSNLDLPIGTFSTRIAMLAITAVVMLFIVFRFGLIALCASIWMYLAGLRLPLTLDTASWYFERSLLALIVIAAAAAFAFALSLGGKPILPGPLFED